MKHFKYLLIATLSLSLYSCGPKVLSSVSKKYARTSIDSVKIFNQGELIPNSSELLGSIKIIDNLPPTKDRYNEVILAGKKKTAKVGGNGLMITNYATTSTMTEADAKMIYFTDMIIDSLAPNPAMENQTLEKNINSDYTKKRVPSNTFSFNFGGGWILNRLDYGTIEINPLSGAEVRFEYNHSFKNGLGIGALYSGFFRQLNFSDTPHLYLNYFGPTITYGFRFNQFVARAGLGFGVTVYDYSVSKGNCFGAHGDLKIEYMFNKTIGLNLTTTMIMCSISDSGPNLNQLNFNGALRFSLTGGLCIYF